MEPDSRIWANSDLLKTWLWCLKKANFMDKKWVSIKSGRGLIDIEIKRGQFVYGRHSAAEELGINPSTVRNRMTKLKDLGFVDIQSDKQYSIITICNYEYYQGRDSSKGTTKRTGERTGNTSPIDTPDDTTKKLKNVKKDKIKEEPPPISPQEDVQEIFDLWNKYAVNRIPHAKILTKTRADKIKARLKENSDIRYWQDVFSKLQKIPFYCGDNNQGWVVTLDYVMGNDTNHVKISERSIEGNDGDGDYIDELFKKEANEKRNAQEWD